jgi:hypothetical protein
VTATANRQAQPRFTRLTSPIDGLAGMAQQCGALQPSGGPVTTVSPSIRLSQFTASEQEYLVFTGAIDAATLDAARKTWC